MILQPAEDAIQGFFIAATLASSFIGGGFTTGLAEKVYCLGLIYVVGLWGFSFKEILVAKYIAPKMVNFPNAYSVGDIMGQLYGKRAKVFTGISAFLVCAGILGAQLIAFGHICNVLLGISSQLGAFICALIVMAYAGSGGMRAVVANDTLHFCVLMVSLPLVFFFGVKTIGGVEKLYFYSSVHFSNNIPYSSIALVFLSFFFGETLVPPYVQRLLIGKTIKHTVRGNMASGLISIPFFLMIGLIGIIAVVMNADLNPNLALRRFRNNAHRDKRGGNRRHDGNYFIIGRFLLKCCLCFNYPGCAYPHFSELKRRAEITDLKILDLLCSIGRPDVYVIFGKRN